MRKEYKQYMFDIAVAWAVWIIFVILVIENTKHSLCVN